MRRTTRPWTFRLLSTLVAGATILVTSGSCLSRKAPWEKASLPPGGTEVTSLHSGPVMDLERVRFSSRELGEPRFFLVLKPHRASGSLDVWILNHGWADRPESLLEEWRTEAIYSRLLAEGRVRPALIVIPDVRFSNSYRVHAERYPFPQYLVLVAEGVAGLVAERYAIPPDRDRWSIGGFSFGGTSRSMWGDAAWAASVAPASSAASTTPSGPSGQRPLRRPDVSTARGVASRQLCYPGRGRA